jgi:hypothetical protein
VFGLAGIVRSIRLNEFRFDSVNLKTLVTFSQSGFSSKSFPRFLQERPSRSAHPFCATMNCNDVVVSNPGATVYAN